MATRLDRVAGRWRIAPTDPSDVVDLRIVVETRRTGVDRLPALNDVPTIVVRTAGLPVPVSPGLVQRDQLRRQLEEAHALIPSRKRAKLAAPDVAS